MVRMPAFAPASSFTPALQTRPCAVSSRVPRAPRMVAPENVRRTEEIKKLQKQLEELRAARERIAREKSASSPPQASVSSPQAVPQPAVESASGANGTNLPFELGKHGESSRFLSLSKVEHDEYFPRILTVAGRVPDLTVAEFMSSPSVLQNRAPDEGNMFITMLPPDYNGQIIAMPGLKVVADAKDPVVVLIGADDLSEAQLPVAEGDDLALLIDRNTEATNFDNTKFHAWDVGGFVRIGWLKDIESAPTAKSLGKVIFGMLEVKPVLREKKSCWEEENESYSG